MGEFSEAALRRVFEYEHELGTLLHDRDDYYRLGSALTKLGRPVSLYVTGTEGLVEDFFASWDSSEDNDDLYSPALSEWDLIFPFV